MASSGETPEDRPGAATPAESPAESKHGTQTGRTSRIVDMTEEYRRQGQGHGGLIIAGTPGRDGTQTARSRLLAMGFKEEPADGLPGTIIAGVGQRKP